MNGSKMPSVKYALVLSFSPYNFFQDYQITVTIIFLPVIWARKYSSCSRCCNCCGSGRWNCCQFICILILTYWSNSLFINLCCKTVAILPPEAITLKNHQCTVISISSISVGKVRAPWWIGGNLATGEPNPFTFLGYVKTLWNKLIEFIKFKSTKPNINIYFFLSRAKTWQKPS